MEKFLQIIGAVKLTRRILQPEGTPVAVGIGHPINLGGIGTKAGFIGLHLTRKAHGQKRPAMEGILEGNDGRSAGCMAGNLNGVLNCLGPAVGKHRLLGERTGSDLIQLFGQFHIGLVHYDMEAGVDVLCGLILDGLDDLVIAVTDIGDADPPCEVDIFLAFHVGDDGTLGLRGKDGMGVERTLRNVFVSLGNQRFIRLHGF